MNNKVLILMSGALWLQAVEDVRAGVIFDNGTPDLIGIGISDYDYPLQIAEDFVLLAGSNTVREVHWWGIYHNSHTPTEPNDWTIRIFEDAGGVPATSPLHAFALGDIGRVDTGTSVTGADTVYAYVADIADTTLTPAATYWLSIVNDTTADTDDDWNWTNSSSFSGNNSYRFNDGESWNAGEAEFAFRLTDVPEPATLSLLGIGGLAAMGRRRRRVTN